MEVSEQSMSGNEKAEKLGIVKACCWPIVTAEPLAFMRSVSQIGV